MTQLIDDLLLAQTRATVDGNWVEPLFPLLADVSAADAFRKPSENERSIAEIVAHLAIWAEWVTGFLSGTDFDVEEWPATGPATAENWTALKDRVTAAYTAMANAMRGLSVTDLEAQPVPEVTKMTRLQGILSITMHAAYHTGQIVKLQERFAGKALETP